jgi:hypothetical protein
MARVDLVRSRIDASTPSKYIAKIRIEPNVSFAVTCVGSQHDELAPRDT